jgi:hypothetical protein|tara:strand:- start:202 stop:393 length:192 start_codon:yes stop_codon:yes gene_type:complete
MKLKKVAGYWIGLNSKSEAVSFYKTNSSMSSHTSSEKWRATNFDTDACERFETLRAAKLAFEN